MHLITISSTAALFSFFVVLVTAYPANDVQLSSRDPAPHAETSLKLTSNYAAITHVKPSRRAKRSLAKRDNGYGSSRLRDLEVEGEWAMPIEFGDQKFSVQVATARANTIVAREGFQCFNATSNPVPEADCAFGTLFQGDFPDGAIKNRHFHTYNTMRQFVLGSLGYEDVTVGGIQVPKQEIGLIDESNWVNDRVTSGILGLAYRALTGAYVGNETVDDKSNVTGNQPGDRTFYSPILETIIQEDLIASPLFSLALQRSKSTAYNTPGGYIAFGGLPPVSFSPVFTSVPIEIFQFDGYPAWHAKEHSYYTIQPDGYVVGDGAGNHVQFPSSRHAIIDSNYNALYVPTSAYNAYFAAISPPPVYNSTYNAYQVDCDSASPFFGVRIGGTLFPIVGADIIDNLTVTNNPEIIFCFLSILDGGEDLGVPVELGTPFLKNVVAVFDVGASKMRFAKHTY